MKIKICASWNGKLLTSNSLDASNNMAPGSIEPILNTCSTAAEKSMKHGMM